MMGPEENAKISHVEQDLHSPISPPLSRWEIVCNRVDSGEVRLCRHSYLIAFSARFCHSSLAPHKRSTSWFQSRGLWLETVWK